MSEEKALCGLCGEPMPENEQMFKYHGYSGSCPKPPLKKNIHTQPTTSMDVIIDEDGFDIKLSDFGTGEGVSICFYKVKGRDATFVRLITSDVDRIIAKIRETPEQIIAMIEEVKS